MKMKVLAAVVLIVLAILVVIHQYLFYGIWWEWEDIHHEAFVIALLFGGVIAVIIREKKI